MKPNQFKQALILLSLTWIAVGIEIGQCSAVNAQSQEISSQVA